MEKLLKMVEDIMVAVTFADPQEFDEANGSTGTEIVLMVQEENSSLSAPVAGK